MGLDVPDARETGARGVTGCRGRPMFPIQSHVDVLLIISVSVGVGVSDSVLIKILLCFYEITRVPVSLAVSSSSVSV